MTPYKSIKIELLLVLNAFLVTALIFYLARWYFIGESTVALILLLVLFVPSVIAHLTSALSVNYMISSAYQKFKTNTGKKEVITSYNKIIGNGYGSLSVLRSIYVKSSLTLILFYFGASTLAALYGATAIMGLLATHKIITALTNLILSENEI